MNENVPITAKLLAEIFSAFLTWLGAAVIVIPLVWWATAFFHLVNVIWYAAPVIGVGWCFAYPIARFIERQRIA